MTNLTQVPLTAFDTETTGVDVYQDRIVSAAAICGRLSGGSAELGLWLINPGIEIPAAAVDVHGLTNEHVQAHGSDPAVTLETIAATLAESIREGAPLVVFNAAFDLVLLDSELRRYGLTPLAERLGGAPIHVIDPLVLDRAFDRYRKGKRRLDTLCQVYGVEVTEAAHDAAADSRMTLAVLGQMASKYPELTEQSLAELQSFQATAHQQWAQSFNEWRHQQGFSGPGASETWLPWVTC
ncbi:DNA polymerase-3 subunit epsilon [Micrococcales bacterium KH10]|nr:DNA polymerase-3 subunit epsilon [Micrococcales bacterium KH10]